MIDPAAYETSPEHSAQADTLRHAARQALAAHDDLLNAWRGLGEHGLQSLCTAEDVELLKQLVIRRIYPANAFAVLAAVARDTAVDVLFSRYLGKRADPDTKFGGYTFELACMLDDLREIHGESALRDILRDAWFKRALLEDPRVVYSFSDALDMDEQEFGDWLNGQ